ncbi:MAG TPA: aldehyde dehydrogenase family protein [Rhodanobacter sp.]
MTTTSSSLETYGGFDTQPIGGTWRSGRSTRHSTDIDPYTGKTLVTIPLATTQDVDDAYQAAAAAQPGWAAAAPAERARVMHNAVRIFDERREEIISWLIHESGSTRVKANIEWDSARAVTLEAASFPYRVAGRILTSDIPGKENRVYRRALGVIGIISPWNFPMHLTQRSLAPALALGNAVVVKPASDTPVSGGLLLAKIFEEAGLPPGVLSVTVGAGSEIGDYFVAHPQPRLISFTGSTAVGQGIGRIASSGTHLKRVALELGGNSPFVVLDDADVDQAVRAAVFGRFLHQGQICMSVNRIIVDAKLHDAFVERFVARVRELKVGDPDHIATAIGPIIDAAQLHGIVEKIALAKQQGATQLLGGEADGLLLPPHVFVDVPADSSLFRDESFGPIVPIVRAKDETDALRLANATDYGLSSAVFCGDIDRGVRFAQGIEAGMTHVNDMSVNDEPHAPFGGEKNSGIGRFGGEWIIDEFTSAHWISVQHTPRSYPF